MATTTLPRGDRWRSRVGAVTVRYGAGRIAELGEIARGLEAREALLVSDAGLEAAGHTGRAREALDGGGLAVTLFTGVQENPTCGQVEAAAAALDRRFDLIVAVGGGSVLDFAKGLNFLLTNGGRMRDYRGHRETARPMLSSIGVPTTAGTGSDAQSYAVLADDASGRKLACGAPGARFREVVLDPDLLRSVPRPTAAAAGIDALSHALESRVSRKRTAASDVLSIEAWRRLRPSYEAWVDPGSDRLAPLGRMLLGAHLAGAAVEASMLGAAHAAANPLTARFRITHGIAVGLMLPGVVRFNSEVAAASYRELEADGGEAIAEQIEELSRRAGLPERLRDCGVRRAALPELAALAKTEWTGGFNPRPVTEKDFLELYEQAY